LATEPPLRLLPAKWEKAFDEENARGFENKNEVESMRYYEKIAPHLDEPLNTRTAPKS
jgi:hypothetical protein